MGKPGSPTRCKARVDAAFAWFDRVEAGCTRFDPDSEMMRLSARIGIRLPQSPMLFEASPVRTLRSPTTQAARSTRPLGGSWKHAASTAEHAKRASRRDAVVATGELEVARPVSYRGRGA